MSCITTKTYLTAKQAKQMTQDAMSIAPYIQAIEDKIKEIAKLGRYSCCVRDFVMPLACSQMLQIRNHFESHGFEVDGTFDQNEPTKTEITISWKRVY